MWAWKLNANGMPIEGSCEVEVVEAGSPEDLRRGVFDDCLDENWTYVKDVPFASTTGFGNGTGWMFSNPSDDEEFVVVDIGTENAVLHHADDGEVTEYFPLENIPKNPCGTMPKSCAGPF